MLTPNSSQHIHAISDSSGLIEADFGTNFWFIDDLEGGSLIGSRVASTTNVSGTLTIGGQSAAITEFIINGDGGFLDSTDIFFRTATALSATENDTYSFVMNAVFDGTGDNQGPLFLGDMVEGEYTTRSNLFGAILINAVPEPSGVVVVTAVALLFRRRRNETVS